MAETAKRKKKGRNSNNHGTCYYSKSDGCWRVRVPFPEKPYKKSFRTEAEAREAHRELLRMLLSGESPFPPDPSNTLEFSSVGDWLEHWHVHTIEGNPEYRIGTKRDYTNIVRTHLIPQFGDLPLAGLTPEHLESYYSSLSEQGRAANTIRHVHKIAKVAMEDAVRRGYLAVNPAAAIRGRSRSVTREMPELSLAEIRELRALFIGRQYERLYVTLLQTGLRIGEALGLRIVNIDFSRRVLHVRESLQRQENYKRHLSDVKTRAGVRSVPFSDEVSEYLQAEIANGERLKARDADKPWRYNAWGENPGLVFVNRYGNGIDANRVGRDFKAMVSGRRAFDTLTVHCLRHLYASQMIHHGIDFKTLSTLMGHANIQTTLNIYGHLLKDSHDAAAEKIRGFFDSQRMGPEP